MAETKFTPGKWHAERSLPVEGVDGWWLVSRKPASNPVYVGWVDGGDENQANANLIAAAPEMYEALTEARERMMGGSPAIRALIAKTDAALAKANGGGR